MMMTLLQEKADTRRRRIQALCRRPDGRGAQVAPGREAVDPSRFDVNTELRTIQVRRPEDEVNQS